MRLRQVALVARELEPVVADLTAVLGIEVAFRDPGVGVFGLTNAVLPVGDGFLEVVRPERPDAAAARFLERRGGDGGYMAIFQSDDLEADRRRVERLGVRVVWEAKLEDAATLHLHPRDVGGAIVSIDWMQPRESWRWAGPDWRRHVRSEAVTGLAGVEIETADPERLARRWAEVLDATATPAGGGSFEIALEGGRVRCVALRDPRGEGISAIELHVADPGRQIDVGRARDLERDGDAVRIGGVWMRPAGASATR